MKVVVNRCFGGFGVSDECLAHMGIKFHRELEVHHEGTPCKYTTNYRTLDDDSEYDIQRTDPRLIKAIEELGSEVCSDAHAKLEIVEIPDNLKHWHIEDYDGSESIIASESEIHYF